MSTDRLNDLRAFRDFADGKLTSGESPPTLDHALALWELENEGEEDRADAVREVREAIDDMRSGDRGVPLDEAIAELRQSLNLPKVS
ncbi:hypothetical protein OJF2_52950 [Aquisphaera giovannonii]|uniref:Uncharacterized protein n=1 Tax=Aquisphaera giovannonii TaxID=406548 RepID=A0A5B9WA28_9BACT|nr:hypothetical protein [Aquisphaera giovannonii]QEH36710.1 hypothetical protein OJF2_52950 [Aquisphaera giovannonii]